MGVRIAAVLAACFTMGCGAPVATLRTVPVAATARPETPTVTLLPGAAPAEPVSAPATLRRLDDGQQVDDPVGGAVVAEAIAPTTRQTWSLLLDAYKTGQRTLLPGTLPAYVPLPANDVAAALARGAGRTVPQGCIGNQDGTRPSEPVTVLVHGSRDALVKAFAGRGWVQANPRSAWSYAKMAGSVLTRLWNERSSPVSAMYLDGQVEAFALNKNGDYVLARDHMRCYPTAGGETWRIAASRDVAATITIHHGSETHSLVPSASFGHETDHEVDGERDLVMADLLAAGVADWQAVTGVLPAAARRHADGSFDVGIYHSDGRVYEVWLK